MGETMDYPDCATDIGIMSFSSKEEQQEWINYLRQQASYIKVKRGELGMDNK